MDTGYRIDPGGTVRSPQGKTRWWVRSNQGSEVIWSRAGDTRWRLVGGRFVDPSGRETGYYVTPVGDGRAIHGPEAGLPWE